MDLIEDLNMMQYLETQNQKMVAKKGHKFELNGDAELFRTVNIAQSQTANPFAGRELRR